MDNLTPITREEILMNDEPLTPITREEKILAGEDLNPVTRREYFLKKYRHAGGDVMVEGLSVTENGTYTAPEGKAYSPVEVNVPIPENAYLLKTASGSLVSFDDGADLPMPSFICNIDAVQDLHGQDAPWVGGAGKNKLPMTVSGIKAINSAGTWSGNVYTTNTGITFTLNTDSDGNVVSIKANGTASGNTALYFAAYGASTLANYLVNGTSYILNGSTGGGSQSSHTYGTQVQANDSWYSNFDAEVQFTYTSGGNDRARVYVSSGATVSNIIFYPMIRLSTETDPTFAPYSNICPISGHTGVDAWVRGKNLMSSEWELGSYGAGGLPSSDDNKIRTKTMISCIPNKSYAVSFTTSKSNVWVYYYEKDGSFIMRADISNTMRFSTPDYCEFIHFRCDKDSEGVNVSCMLVFGETASTYEPYNPNSQTIQVSWQTEAGEVYGGYVDLVSGVLTITDEYIASYDSETLPSTWISDRDIYAEGTTPTMGAEVVYKLANPQTYQLDGNQIKSLLDNNNAWCDTGDVDIDYFAKEVTE